MPEIGVRFAVGDGRVRAETWKCWATRGQGKNDVYLAPRTLGHALKASLHASGKWRVAFHSDFLSANAVADEWPTRVVENWDRPPAIAPGFTLAYRIVTPSAAVNLPASDSDPADITWVPPPPPTFAVEVDVTLIGNAADDGWPGKNSMGTSLVGRFQLDGGENVCLVSHIVRMPVLQAHGVSPRFFRGRNADSLHDRGLRALVFGVEPDGSRVVYDLPAKKSDEAATGEMPL